MQHLPKYKVTNLVIGKATICRGGLQLDAVIKALIQERVPLVHIIIDLMEDK